MVNIVLNCVFINLLRISYGLICLYRFVLLKERNMLMTMEEVCKEAWEIFPNPERLDKVQDSMNNLESVVRERNRAYHLLETGETGERPGKVTYNCLGIKFVHITSVFM